MAGDPRAASIRECLRETSALFRDQFDRNWLLLLLERFPIDAMALSEIRGMTDGEGVLDHERLAFRAALLEDYVRHLRRYLLPGIREKLGISGFRYRQQIWAQDQLLLRRLVAATFPANLDRLGALAARLRALLVPVRLSA